MCNSRKAALRAALVGLVAAACLVGIPAEADAAPPVQGTSGPTGLVYLPMYGDGTVQVIDPAQHRVVKTIPFVGDHPIVLKTTPDHSKLFVGSLLLPQIAVIDVATNTVRKRIWTIGTPWAVTALSNDGRYLYVPTSFSVVQVIDTTTLDIVRTFLIAIPPEPVHLEVARDDRSFYFYSALGAISQFDAQTGQMLKPPLGVEGIVPGWGALSADGATLYSINLLSSSVSLIDPRDWKVTKVVQLPLGSTPLSATLTPDGSQLWVADLGTNDVTILNAHSGVVLKIIQTANAPSYVGFSTDGKTAYVSDMGASTHLPDEAGIFKSGIAFMSGLAFLSTLGMPGYLDTYDVASATLTGSTAVGDAPIGGIYP